MSSDDEWTDIKCIIDGNNCIKDYNVIVSVDCPISTFIEFYNKLNVNKFLSSNDLTINSMIMYLNTHKHKYGYVCWTFYKCSFSHVTYHENYPHYEYSEDVRAYDDLVY